MIFEIKSKLKLTGMKKTTAEAIKQRLTLDNPKYQEAIKMGRWTGNIEPVLTFYEQTGNGDLICPRGFVKQAYFLCKNYGEQIWITDNRRRVLKPIRFAFQGELRPFQRQPVEDCLRHDHGLLSAPPGAGKTVMACHMIAQRQQPAIVLVHTKELLWQWRDRIKSFLGVEAGIIGDGKQDIKCVTIATAQSLIKMAEEAAPHFGFLIADECHHAPAMQYVQVIEQFDCKYLLGLSGTPYRRDGLSRVIYWHLGDLTGQIEKADLIASGDLCAADVVWTKTNFETQVDASENYTTALSELAENDERNQLIARTVAKDTGDGISLVLSDRKQHCFDLANILENKYEIKAEVLTGSTGNRDRQRILDDLRQDKCRCLIATSQLIGEGFDLPAISSLFLVTPIRYHGRLIQYIGRALRPAPGKDRAIVYDFVDVLNPVFLAQAKKRSCVYGNEGIETLKK